MGHSVPIIDGIEQGAGRKYHATVLEASDARFSMEIQEAYETDISKIVRTFDMQEEGITMTDEYATVEGHEIIERFISVIEPEIDGECVRIGDAVLYANTLPNITKDAVNNKKRIPEPLWLIDYPVTEKTFTIRVKVEGK